MSSEESKNNTKEETQVTVTAAEEGACQSLGQKIKAIREQNGLSLGDVAERLKLSVRQVEALENDQFDRLPGVVFTRGFFRSYAKMLKMDDAEIMADLNTFLPLAHQEQIILTETAEGSDSGRTADSQNSGGSGKWVIVGLAILIIGFGGYLFFGKQTPEGDSGVAKQTVASENTSEPALASDPAILINTSSSEQQTPSVASGVVVNDHKLVITTGYKTYLTVTDGKGIVLVNSQLVPARSVHEFPAENAPYTIKIGYAGNSVVTFNGQPIVIQDKIKNKTLEMTIPEE